MLGRAMSTPDHENQDNGNESESLSINEPLNPEEYLDIHSLQSKTAPRSTRNNLKLDISTFERQNQEALKQKYILGPQLCSGSLGSVYYGRDKATREVIAIKYIICDSAEVGCNPTSLIRDFMAHEMVKESKFVLQHYGVNFDSGTLEYCIITEFVADTLGEYIEAFPNGLPEHLIKVRIHLPSSRIHVKRWMFQLFSALEHCHSRGVMHRSIDSECIFIKDKNIKLTAFTSSVSNTHPHRFNTPIKLRTICAPELLFNSDQYDQSIDIWSAGCLFAEMLRGKPLIEGGTDLEILHNIFSTLGYCDEFKNEHVNLYAYGYEDHASNFSQKFENIALSTDGLDLLKSCLEVNPEKRITATNALHHPYFSDISQEILKEFDMIRTEETPWYRMPNRPLHSHINIAPIQGVEGKQRTLSVNIPDN